MQDRRHTLVALAGLPLAACSSHRYYAEAMQYHALATAILVRRGICSDPQDCQRKELLFAEGGEFSLGLVAWGGAYITLYRTNTDALVQEISAAFRDLHTKLKLPKVVLTVYSSARGESKVKFREVEFA